MGVATANNNVTSALDEYAWKKRQLIVFSRSAENNQYQLFTKLLIEYNSEFDERNLQTWHVINDSNVTLNSIKRNDIDAQNFREAFNVNKNEFYLLLIGYDQGEKIRQSKVDFKHLFTEIDQMQMRLQEMRQN